jgi:hypothetical protein
MRTLAYPDPAIKALEEHPTPEITASADAPIPSCQLGRIPGYERVWALTQRLGRPLGTTHVILRRSSKT